MHADRRLSSPVTATASAGGGSLRVLLVDDSVVIQRIAALMLERAGHQVTVASSGHEALRLLDQAAFDVVLIDVEMPEMDGPATVVELRKRGKRDLPVVALTAHDESAQQQRCLDAGIDGFLTKPFRAIELDDAVTLWAGGVKESGVLLHSE
jgi:CheY-like chemotaxis protein